MPRDVLAAADPDAVMRADVLDKADQCLGPAGVPRQAHVHPDRHHLRVFRAFLVEQVEAATPTGEERRRYLEPGEDAVKPPPADPRAVFEHAFGGEVAAVAGIGAGALDQASFRDAVALRMGQLRAFLEIDHEIDRDTRFARPARMWRLGAVADKIAGGHMALLRSARGLPRSRPGLRQRGG